jgi:hypothetical protein
MRRARLELADAERTTLVEMRDHHPKAYLRERAAALLKLADGQGIGQVARAGLLRPRHWETVHDWLGRYQDLGLGGLYIRPGRGRHPVFSPSQRRAGPG